MSCWLDDRCFGRRSAGEKMTEFQTDLFGDVFTWPGSELNWNDHSNASCGGEDICILLVRRRSEISGRPHKKKAKVPRLEVIHDDHLAARVIVWLNHLRGMRRLHTTRAVSFRRAQTAAVHHFVLFCRKVFSILATCMVKRFTQPISSRVRAANAAISYMRQPVPNLWGTATARTRINEKTAEYGSKRSVGVPRHYFGISDLIGY
ncbi:hypothetical protein BDV95DRAFT_591889 [Massariosphaeria phaeospora]|uniref:Uncharacterized protein n=1 Tax=Massariosphaeria phaeospora TaxID=100035 RepID=A0A7C8MUB0_9PLEO|nr:hypothetical protein BDV95DRAFT_591889 [Massariosphaeria phaeospora]